MMNAIPFIGWFIDFVVKASMSLPFWLIWTKFGIGEKYFYFLPEVYQSISFWDCVGLFIAVPIAYSVFIPKIMSVSNSNENKKMKKTAEC